MRRQVTTGVHERCAAARSVSGRRRVGRHHTAGYCPAGQGVRGSRRGRAESKLSGLIENSPFPQSSKESPSITASEARQWLVPLIEQVNNDQAAVGIVSERGTAYLGPADEYHSLRETVHLLRSPANARRMRASIYHVQAGQADEHKMLDADSDSD